MVGATLGHYKIVEKIGAGGMGEVFRATDTKLGREVAVKLLPEEFARDPERLARFGQEARLLAALNHPNIAAIYGLEEAPAGGTAPGRAGRVQFLVLELVPGETLAERIGRGAIPVEEALGMARQIAEALEAAHERGIIHRDLKPANVKVTPEGTVKVLDFGLAKAFAPEGGAGVQALSPSPGSPGQIASPREALSQSPTATYHSPTGAFGGTQQGVILGTAGYMSPEQARGKPLDKRTDIWSFGCVLYELLTGKRAFAGETLSDTIANILKREPNWEALPSDAPAGVGRVLRRCLQKDPQRRLQHIGDARVEIDEAIAASSGALPGVAETTGTGTGAPSRRTIPLSLAAAMAILTGLLAAAGVWSVMQSVRPAPRDVMRFIAVSAESKALRGYSWDRALALSPDGTRLAYVATHQGANHLFLREMDRMEATLLAGTEGAYGPFFSPDGAWLGFFADRRMKKVSVKGGSPLIICDTPQLGACCAHWTPDGTILFSPAWNTGLARVPASGGAPEIATIAEPAKGDIGHFFPQLLPGGRAILYTNKPPGIAWMDEVQIAIQVLSTGVRTVLVEGGMSGRYIPTGHLVYARRGALLAVPFDLARLETTGPPVQVLEGVITTSWGGFGQFDISDTGTLAFVPGPEPVHDVSVVLLDRRGTSRPLLLETRGYASEVTFSPDGAKLAIKIAMANDDIWVYEMGRGTLTRLTFEGGDERMPVWTPDGGRVAYSVEMGGPANIFWKPADGSGAPELLLRGEYPQYPSSFSPDGKLLAYMEIHPATRGDIWILPLEGERNPRPFLQSSFREWAPRFSPDGRWIAYASDESGRFEVYVQPFPGPGRKQLISTDGGIWPVWTQGGRELFYRIGNRMMVAGFDPAGGAAGRPAVLFEGEFIYDEASPAFDVDPRGQSFVMVKRVEKPEASAQIHMVLNWFEELKRQVPSGSR